MTKRITFPNSTLNVLLPHLVNYEKIKLRKFLTHLTRLNQSAFNVHKIAIEALVHTRRWSQKTLLTVLHASDRDKVLGLRKVIYTVSQKRAQL